MSTYTGTFVVVNNTGGTITNCIVSHVCSGQPTTTFGPGTLTEGQTSNPPTALSTQSSSKDRWSVSFLNSLGELMTGQENCGFESEDQGGKVLINLGSEKFDIVMPKSSSCNNNSYQQT
jgi:hypothetical protein